MKNFFRLNKLVNEMAITIEQLKGEIVIRETMIEEQNKEIAKLLQQILTLEDDKKALNDIVKKGVQPLVHEGKSKRKES